jgi:glycosyltransferase involved in cell wall biosynthesis
MYNAERYIEGTLKSVMNQTFQGFELLIVDDCSTDGSVALVERFFRENPRQYELVRFEKNGGIANARNFALNHAKTKFLLFLDADDLFDATLIEKEYNRIVSDEDLMAVSCWSRFMNMNGNLLSGGTYLGEKRKEEFIEKASKGKLIFLPIHTMFDRELAIRAGGFCVSGFPDGKPRYSDFCEELDLWTRMSDLYAEGKAMVVVPEELYYYRKADGLSSNHFNMIIKMRYTKTNVRRRRRGERNLSFIEFYNSLSKKDLRLLKHDAVAADSLRNAVFYLYRGNVVMFVWLVLKSIWYKPLYICDKIRYNLTKKR